MIEEIVLLTGIDIPFQEAGVVIHQPTVKEIAYIGEKRFFIGCGLLNFSKETLTSEDKDSLKDSTDFDIILSILREKKNISFMENAIGAISVLTLLFPTCEIFIQKDKIVLQEREDETIQHIISNNNYEAFRKIVKRMFLLMQNEEEYNPKGNMATRIADKLRRGRDKVSRLQDTNEQISIFGRYISVLTVGQHKDMNTFKNYTTFQLFDEYERFVLKESYDLYIKGRLAGAKDMQAPDDWKKDLYSKKK